MDYRCRLGSLGNSSTASGSSDPLMTEGPSYKLGRQYFFFCARCTFHIFTLLFLSSSFVCVILFLLFPCASVQENNRA